MQRRDRVLPESFRSLVDRIEIRKSPAPTARNDVAEDRHGEGRVYLNDEFPEWVFCMFLSDGKKGTALVYHAWRGQC